MSTQLYDVGITMSTQSYEVGTIFDSHKLFDFHKMLDSTTHSICFKMFPKLGSSQ